MPPTVNIKHMFIVLVTVLPLTLLLVSYRGTIAPLLGAGQDIGILGNFFPRGNKVIINNVYVRPPPWSDSLPSIYVITPTYYRLVQKAELTHMSNTLLHVANLHWIVVEDADRKSNFVRRLLDNTGLNYTHLNVHITKKLKSRGGGQRNVGLKWLRDTFSVNDSRPGVVYFGDDDNTYSLQLFDEMRYTKKVSVWPVGFVGGVRFESPKVNALGKVYGWNVKYARSRPFAIDMAGFAVNLQLILSKPGANFKLYGIPSGHQETRFLEGLVTLSDLEPKAENCTKVLVWHTRTSNPSIPRGYQNPRIET